MPELGPNDPGNRDQKQNTLRVRLNLASREFGIQHEISGEERGPEHQSEGRYVNGSVNQLPDMKTAEMDEGDHLRNIKKQFTVLKVYLTYSFPPCKHSRTALC